MPRIRIEMHRLSRQRLGGDHALFHRSLGVAFEQDGGLLIPNPHDQRVVVGGAGFGMIIRRRSENADMRAAEEKPLTGNHPLHGDIFLVRQR